MDNKLIQDCKSINKKIQEFEESTWKNIMDLTFIGIILFIIEASSIAIRFLIGFLVGVFIIPFLILWSISLMMQRFPDTVGTFMNSDYWLLWMLFAIFWLGIFLTESKSLSRKKIGSLDTFIKKIISILIPSWVDWYIFGLFYPLQAFYPRLIASNIQLSSEINWSHDIVNILEIIQSIHALILKLKKYKIIFWIIYARWFRERLNNILEIEYTFLLNILTDLRSDLVTRLAEQRSALESAKTEVEKNITGTPELLAVSEAQKLRLDRQIEQFEELQRVLVRV
jgi:hypothetical protein